MGIKNYRNNYLRWLGYGWRLVGAGFFIASILSGVGPIEIFNRTVVALIGEREQEIALYASSCATTSESGWLGPEKTLGAPSVLLEATTSAYSRENSAYYAGGTSSIVCAGFVPRAATAPDAVASSSGDMTAELDQPPTEIASGSVEATTTIDIDMAVIAEPSEPANETGTSAEALISPPPESASATDTPVTSTASLPEVNDNGEPAPEVPPAENLFTELAGELVETMTDSIEAIGQIVGDLAEAAQAEAALPPAKPEELGRLVSARLNLSLAQIAAGIELINDSGVEQATSSEANETASSSPAATGTPAADIIVWYAIDEPTASASGETVWQELASWPLASSTACASIKTMGGCQFFAAGAGGYLTFDTPFVTDWRSAANLRLKVEGRAENGAAYEFYLDSVWLTAKYEPRPKEEPDEGLDLTDKIVVDNREIEFAYTDDNQDENLLIKTDRKDYAGVTEATVYFSLANLGSSTEMVGVQAHFPSDAGEMLSLERLTPDGKTWIAVELKDEALAGPNLIEQFLGEKIKRKPVPETLKAKQSSAGPGVRLAAGKMLVYRLKISFPIFSSGEFYLEAIGDGEGYGLLDPWWSSSWGYKLPITIDNQANSSALADYQILVEIASTTAGFWEHVASDGSDIRFLDGSETTSLDYWLQYWNKAASTTQIWVQVDSIPAAATSTIYLYYGNAAAASTSNMYSTFSYSSMQDLYYVVTNTFATVTVVSLIDNNQVQLNNGTAVNLNRQQITSFTPVTATSTLRAKGPVQASITGVQAGTTLVPIAYASTAFVVPYGTNVSTEAWSRYAPFAAATTTIYNGNTADTAVLIPSQTAATRVYNIANNGTTRLLATNPVLATYYISATTYSAAVYPATLRDLYGIRSGTNRVGFTGNTNFTIYCSGGASANVINQTTANPYTNATCAAANEGAGDAVRLTAQTNPIGSVQYNDSDGTSMSVFLPDVELATEYMVPHNTAYIAVACLPKQGTTTLSIYDPSDVFVASSTCTPTATNPGKAYFGVADTATYNAGSRIVSDNGKSFYAYYEDAQALGAAGGDEANFLGAVQARKQATSSPTYSLGAEVVYTISVSGKVYSNEGTSTLLTAPIVALAIDSQFIATTAASAVDGSYIFNNVTPPKLGSTTIVYLDNNATSGVAYDRYYGDLDVAGLDIYANRIILRHDDAGPITNAEIDKYDGNQDTDIKLIVSGGNLTASSSERLYLWPGDTYAPGGAVTLAPGAMPSAPGGDLYIASSTSVFNAGANAVSVGGDWISLGTFSKAVGQTVTFTGTSSGFVVNNNANNFENVTFNGGGGWSFADVTLLDGDLAVANGTLAGTADITVSGGNATGDGAISLTGGTFTLSGVGNLGGSTAWNFASLTLGDGATIATTSKAGSGGVNVASVLTLGTNHRLAASSSVWTLSGSGNAFIANGLLLPESSTFKFTSTNDTNIPAINFYRLELAPAGAGTPTYTLLSGTLSTGGYLYVGDGTNAVTATAGANDTGLAISGDFWIKTAGAFTAPPTSAFQLYSSWTDDGSFTANGGTVSFIATTTGKTIAAGASAFYDADFIGANGGWTVTENATSTNDWTLAAGSQFTVASGATLAVGGLFTNSLPGAATTWTGSTLYLYGGAQTINGKTSSNDAYGTLAIGPSTDIKMWNSSATAYLIMSGGSLYSMDHNGVDGSLYIWGDYQVTTGAEYWSAATDFDGASLGAAARQANVRLASSATTTITGATLNLVGSSTATTTVANQGSGTYALTISGGTINAGYFQFRNLDASGFNLVGANTVSSLSNGDLELAVSGGSLISVAAATVSANPALDLPNLRFATSSGATTGLNASLSGTPSSYWTFGGAYGNLAGDDFDSDPGDPRGYLVWDDSPSAAPKSQDWRWYHDQGSETPISPAAATNTAPSNIANANKLKLRLTIKETSGIDGQNVKMRLEYSTFSDFSANVNFVGEIGSTTALWTYADGVDTDNATVTTRLLGDSTAAATHNESGTSTSNYTLAANSAAEWEFTIMNNGAAAGTTYYFRAYSPQNPPLGAILVNFGETYPSLAVGADSLDTTMTGLPAGTSLEGAVADINSNNNAVPFGTLNASSSLVGMQRLTISTNAETGYQLFVYKRTDLVCQNGSAMFNAAGTNESPAAWSVAPNPSAFGYHTSDDTLSGAAPSRFAADNTYARLETAMKEVGYSPIPVNNDIINMVYRLAVTPLQSAGDYQTELVYIVVPTY